MRTPGKAAKAETELVLMLLAGAICTGHLFAVLLGARLDFMPTFSFVLLIGLGSGLVWAGLRRPNYLALAGGLVVVVAELFIRFDPRFYVHAGFLILVLPCAFLGVVHYIYTRMNSPSARD